MSVTLSTTAQLRQHMPIAEHWAYLDHACVSPMSGPACKRISDWLLDSSTNGGTRWPVWAAELERVRKLGATFVGATPEEIAFVPSTTAGINIVSEGLPWESGDNIVIPDDEFPSNVFPWKNLASKGIELRTVPTENGKLDLKKFEEACDAKTRAVSVSWVAYASGYRRDLASLAEIVHRHDTFFFVDAIQGLGVFPLDVKALGIDAIAADGHKWLLGPEGAALAYFSERLLEQLAPLGVGWHSVVQAGDFANLEPNWKTTADRYEGGSPNMVGFLGFGASLKMLWNAGIENVAEAVLDISDYAAERLKEVGANILSNREGDVRSGIIVFECPNHTADDVKKHLLKCKVALTSRFEKLRISPHAYNTREDIDQLIEGLKSMPS